jgi:hypothetical protein
MILGVTACAASLFVCGATHSIALSLASGAYNWGLEKLFLLMVVLPLLFAFAFMQNDYDLEKMNVESSGPQPPYRCKIITTSKKICTLLAIWLHPLTWLPPKKMVARHPMVLLLAIWLRLLTWLPPKKWLHDLLWLRDLLWLH